MQQRVTFMNMFYEHVIVDNTVKAIHIFNATTYDLYRFDLYMNRNKYPKLMKSKIRDLRSKGTVNNFSCTVKYLRLCPQQAFSCL